MFQLIDDMLDFISTSEVLGKPAAADLKLGLATAPVLFASEMVGNVRTYVLCVVPDYLHYLSFQYPELEPMIMRRFAHREDIDWALSRVRLVGSLYRINLIEIYLLSVAMTIERWYSKDSSSCSAIWESCCAECQESARES